MFCEVYQKENNKAEKKRILAEKLMEHFDESITDETEDFVINTVFKSSRYIFIKKVKTNICLYGENRNLNRYYAYCTHCKEEYEIDQYLADSIFHHNHKCQCQKCRSKCIAKHERYGRSKLIDTSLFITYDKSKIDAGTITAKGYCVSRDYTENYKQVTTHYTNLSRYIFTLGNSYMLTKNYYQGWFLRDSCCSYKDGYGNYTDYVDTESITRAVSNTKFRYSPYKEYMEERHYRQDDMTLFFYQYSKYPIVEKLIKSGFEGIADRIVRGCSLERSVNYKQTDVSKFLGINKAEIKEIKASGVEFKPSFLRMYKYAKKEKLGWDISRVESEAKERTVEYFNSIKKYSGINKALAYLKKQSKYSDLGGITIIWKDYIENCNKLDIDIKKSINLFPRDLHKRHDEVMKQIKVVADEATNTKIEARLKELRKKYYYESDKFIIRPAESVDDLIHEGNTLDHCVARNYTGRYADGDTDILFIREKESPYKPYFTMEVRRGSIIQVQGYQNKEDKTPAKGIIEEFKNKKLKKKKQKKVA